MTAPEHLAVVLPARNEEKLLPAALSSVRTAARALQDTARVQVGVTVVLDSCTDGSAAAAARIRDLWLPELDLRILSGSFGTVGAARAAGIAARPQHPGLWIANTDADTVVPPHWLTCQHRFASAGYGLVLGTAVPDPADLSAAELAAWRKLHPLGEGHPHIHGANMGFSAAAYRRAGGFAPLASHEDVDLAVRLKAAGTAWTATDMMQVVTSGRRDGRAPEGFSRFLSQLLPG